MGFQSRITSLFIFKSRVMYLFQHISRIFNEHVQETSVTAKSIRPVLREFLLHVKVRERSWKSAGRTKKTKTHSKRKVSLRHRNFCRLESRITALGMRRSLVNLGH